MFFQSQAFPTEIKTEKNTFCQAFFNVQKKPEFQNLALKKPKWQPWYCNQKHSQLHTRENTVCSDVN